jgi:hypothetical protein
VATEKSLLPLMRSKWEGRSRISGYNSNCRYIISRDFHMIHDINV